MEGLHTTKTYPKISGSKSSVTLDAQSTQCVRELLAAAQKVGPQERRRSWGMGHQASGFLSNATSKLLFLTEKPQPFG